MSTELRNLLRQQNIRRQEANSGAEKKSSADRSERFGILDALRDQERRDNIILTTKFQPLDVRRREQRMDAVIRTTVAEIIEGLNDNDSSKINTNLTRMKEIILKENPSMGMISKVKNFLTQLVIRLPELGNTPEMAQQLISNATEVNNLASNKIVSNDVFKDLMKSIDTTDVDKFTTDQLEELRQALEIEKMPIIQLKRRIKNILGNDISQFQSPNESFVLMRDDIRKKIYDEFQSMTKEDLIRDYLKTKAQKGKITQRFNSVGLEKGEWKDIQESKDEIIKLLTDDYLIANELFEPENTKSNQTLKSELNTFFKDKMTDDERKRNNLDWDSLISKSTGELIEIYDQYMRKLSYGDLVKVRKASDKTKPKVSDMRDITRGRKDQATGKLAEMGDRLLDKELLRVFRELRAETEAETEKEEKRRNDPGYRNRMIMLRREMADERKEKQNELDKVEMALRAQELMRIGREGVGADESKEGDEDVDG